MNKAEICHIIALALQPHIAEGRSAGMTKNNMAIRVKDNEGNEFVINVMEESKEG
jgi:hypothetical protein